MACVPGGAFLLGNPTFVPLSSDMNPVPEQLVQLGPFTLDIDEITVAEMRALVAKSAVSAPLSKGIGLQGYCTYTNTGNDTLPVDCVTAAQAHVACAALGKRLPTEAEWEYAAGNLALETAYPWGAAGASVDVNGPCQNAVVGHGDPTDPNMTFSVACQTSSTGPVGPQPVGATTTDLTMLGLRNMGGNVSEITADAFQPYSGPTCWGPSAVLHVNPTCAAGGLTSVRGGSWGDGPFWAGVYYRNGVSMPDPLTGFRCAK
jgi:formylglycine-generating enzyme required for sulfatase activity